MSSHIPAVKPTHIDVEWYIARARRMRGEYFAQIFKTGFGSLRDMVAQRAASKPSVESAHSV